MNMNKQRKMHKVTKIHSLTSKTEQKKKKKKSNEKVGSFRVRILCNNGTPSVQLH